MERRKKSGKVNRRLAVLLFFMIIIGLLSAFFVYAQSYHWFGKQDIINIIESGRDASQMIIESATSVGGVDVDVKSVGFQKAILILICTLAGVIVNWEANKSNGQGAPQGPPPMARGR